jgi:hypothetical protein
VFPACCEAGNVFVEYGFDEFLRFFCSRIVTKAGSLIGKNRICVVPMISFYGTQRETCQIRVMLDLECRFVQRSARNWGLPVNAAGERTLDHLTDRLENGSVELLETYLLDGREIGRLGVERAAQKWDRVSVASQGRRLSHDVFAGKIVATLAQHAEITSRPRLIDPKASPTQLGVKCGALRDPAGGCGGTDNRRAHVKNYLAQILRGSILTTSTSIGR